MRRYTAADVRFWLTREAAELMAAGRPDAAAAVGALARVPGRVLDDSAELRREVRKERTRLAARRLVESYVAWAEERSERGVCDD